ncbi:unnamed protein product [Kuraishia capsulata CBS 1993]|uniref:Uncharacterized protein n=1 Tax=Kuraishia capsulata CBS 1993 TaxID=1382522 RepID=W6MIQ9_9ASCO|nr:uncharacterized protein KUCA_T00002002001 [Kuraishia capsulata CBS 1993]CDK26031.1 unnamed protein product [Kuraishia capsulata CBS 1993]
MSPFQFTSSAPYQSPHIPNCTRQLEGHLIGCLMNSPSANKDGAGFPSNFDPRMEPNMPATKKVIGWLNELPVDITAPRSFKNGCFELEHYNGLEVEDLIELLWPDEDAAIECSTDELIASQAKQIEFLTSKLYSMEYTRTPEEVTKTALRSSPPSYNVRLINR